jgi:FlaA1/EpsC-like NDP-sugar epimerase
MNIPSQTVRRGLVIVTHAVLFALSCWTAYLLRFDGVIPQDHDASLSIVISLFVAIKLVAFGAMRLYSGWWRYASFDDFVRLAKAAVVSAVAVAAVLVAFNLRTFPRSVIAVDTMITVSMLGGLRFAIRLLRERQARKSMPAEGLARTLVVGTGHSAESLLREAKRGSLPGVSVVGIVDETRQHVGSLLSSVPVLGSIEEIQELAARHHVSQVIIAPEPNQGELVRRVVSQCISADLKHRVLPPTDQILSGSVTVSVIREVSLQDLLGRPPVRLDGQQIASLVSGSVVLVTGAGGSIGSELCRQVARFGPSQIIMVEQAENPLFHLERELVGAFSDISFVPVVADVADGRRMSHICRHYRPKVVLHAAAHKHVPLMEANPWEAVKNNILGTLNVINASQESGVNVAVLISTDKAVNPTSVMGASKRVAEMLVQALASRSRTRLAAVRFGNVLGSNGSVIPIFKEQIAKGGPVTVTHPELRRYFMTIPEATQLVLQAATYAEGGDVFVLDMGEPVHIVDVARDLIRLSGLEPDVDIKIEFSGMRPGEKLFEELSVAGENTLETPHNRIFRYAVEPPETRTVLEAASRLADFAATDAPPAHVRDYLFGILEALETREPLEHFVTASDRLIRHRGSPSSEVQ